MMLTKAHWFGLCLASLHALGFALLNWYVVASSAPQPQWAWIFVLAVDFPVSLLNFVGVNLLNELGAAHPLLAQILGNIVDGFLGTIWWYLVGYYSWRLASGGPRAKTVPERDCGARGS